MTLARWLITIGLTLLLIMLRLDAERFSTVVLVVAITAPAGYALAKFKMRFGTVILLIFVLTMQAPVPVIPLYVLLVKLNMTDSYIGYILPLTAGGIPLAIFIFRAFFTTVPRELEEAAVVDGSTYQEPGAKL